MSGNVYRTLTIFSYLFGGDLSSLTVDLEVLGALRVLLDVVVDLVVGEGAVLVDGVRPGHLRARRLPLQNSFLRLQRKILSNQVRQDNSRQKPMFEANLI